MSLIHLKNAFESNCVKIPAGTIVTIESIHMLSSRAKVCHYEELMHVTVTFYAAISELEGFEINDYVEFVTQQEFEDLRCVENASDFIFGDFAVIEIDDSEMFEACDDHIASERLYALYHEDLVNRDQATYYFAIGPVPDLPEEYEDWEEYYQDLERE